MNADSIKIEYEEDGFHIVIDGDSVDPDYQAGCYSWKITDPEAFYDHVKAAIGPWLYERDQARSEYVVAVREAGRYRTEPDEDAYDPTDPKHPRYHSTHADIWDQREGK